MDGKRHYGATVVFFVSIYGNKNDGNTYTCVFIGNYRGSLILTGCSLILSGCSLILTGCSSILTGCSSILTVCSLILSGGSLILLNYRLSMMVIDWENLKTFGSLRSWGILRKSRHICGNYPYTVCYSSYHFRFPVYWRSAQCRLKLPLWHWIGPWRETNLHLFTFQTPILTT